MENRDTGIWVYAELEDGSISPTTYELLAKSIDLKEKLGGRDEITAVLLGGDIERMSKILFSYGAEKVIAAESTLFGQYKHRIFTDALVELVSRYHPSIFLFPASPMGRELAPRVMCRLDTGLTADAIDLDVDEDGTFVQTTPNFGGSILSHIAIPVKRPQMCTVHPRVFSPIEPVEGAKGELVVEQLSLHDDEDYVVISREAAVSEGTPISEAKVLVSGGFGIKEENDLAMLSELAELIGGEVACSRPLCDNGWLPHSKQIGQSGSTVKPNVIINVAISGSLQYVAGMDKAKSIISINKDKDAPIFDVSHTGAVADYRELLPAIIDKIKQRKEK